jgi:hypothetical protein
VPEYAPPTHHAQEARDGRETSFRNGRPWRYFAERVNALWLKGPEFFIEIGHTLLEAKEELSRDEFDALLKLRLDLDASVGRKLMCSASNPTLCAHVHRLPPCWSTIYELSQVPHDTLEAAIADGRVNPKMLRKDAVALRKPKDESSAESEDSDKGGPPPNRTFSFAAAWDAASDEEIRAKLDAVGRDGICRVMSDGLKAEIRDHILGLTIDAASRTSSFAVQATNKLHTAMRSAEQPESDHEAVGHMRGALLWIARGSERRDITRSEIVVAIADRNPKHRKKK